MDDKTFIDALVKELNRVKQDTVITNETTQSPFVFIENKRLIEFINELLRVCGEHLNKPATSIPETEDFIKPVTKE